MSHSRFEYEMFSKIADRAIALAKEHGTVIEKFTMVMDIDNAHKQIPMDLNAFLAMPMVDFAHDAFGIRRHMNRRTGQLEDCFVPRCALREHQGA